MPEIMIMGVGSTRPAQEAMATKIKDELGVDATVVPPEPVAAKVDHRLTPEERQERLASAFDELNSAVEKITTGEDWQRYLDWQSKFSQYSARNVMWLAEQAEQRGMDLEMVASFNAWKKMGRMVNKGEHGLKVLAPVTYRREETDAETGQTIEEKRIRGFKVETVFDVSQTSGPDSTLPTNPMRVTPIEGRCDPQIIKAIEREIKKQGYVVEAVDGEQAGWPPATNGHTSVSSRIVRIRDDLSPAAQAKTMTHELAHITMEHDRSDTRSETEAESVAYLTMQHLGIDSGSYSFGYVAGWAEDVNVVQRSAEAIRKTADQICSHLDDRLAPMEIAPLGLSVGVPMPSPSPMAQSPQLTIEPA